MLLGYKQETGEIEFLFTDETYLEKMFPGNSAKISNFWKMENHGLTELFISEKDFPNCRNYQLYKVINNKMIRKTEEEIELDSNKNRLKEKVKDNYPEYLSISTKINSLEEKIKELELENSRLKEVLVDKI